MRSLFLNDEELGKKDDDHKLHKHQRNVSNGGPWQPARSPRRRHLKRGLLAALIVGLIYLFIHNMPTNLGANPAMRRPTYIEKPLSNKRPNGGVKNPAQSGASTETQQQHQVEQVGTDSTQEQEPATPKDAEGQQSPTKKLEERSYNGPLKFPNLAVSLKAIGPTRGSVAINKNILFAASSLKSAATLLPMACDMGSELRSYVHFVFMGRSDIDMAELQKINGIDSTCSLIFHDARPDFSETSTEARMEKASFRAFHHIHTYVHPQAIFIDASGDEDPFFHRGARQQAEAVGNTIIDVPPNAARKLAWVNKLNSQALRMWNKVSIDILIQATPGTTGSLIRLLKSLQEADYTAGSLPHITIELPQDIDIPTKRFLEGFSWPPRHVYNPSKVRLLSLRHRIPSQKLNEDETAARFLESFWPANPGVNDVLILSPQAELSANYYHFVKFTLLANRFQQSMTSEWDKRLFGISLGQPQYLLDGKTKLSPPISSKTIWQDGKDRDVIIESYLSTAPTNDAILIMGDKWIELHDLVSRTLAVQSTERKKKKGDKTEKALEMPKAVAKQYPSWVEHATRLCRARGYWTLYPGARMAKELISIHGELSKPPEEYSDLHTTRPSSNLGETPSDSDRGKEKQQQQLLSDDASETEVEEARRRLKAESDVGFTHTALLTVLPNQGHVIPLPELPTLNWDGTEVDYDGNEKLAVEFSRVFRKEIGGCPGGGGENEGNDGADGKARVEGKVVDLFCN